MITALVLLNILMTFLLLGATYWRRDQFRRALPLFASELRRAGLSVAGGVGPARFSRTEVEGLRVEVVLRPKTGAPEVSMAVAAPPSGFFEARPKPPNAPPGEGPDAQLRQRVDLQALNETTLCRLKGPVRAALLELVQAGWSIEPEDAGAALAATRTGLPDELGAAVAKLRTLALALTAPDDVPTELLERVRSEPRTSIRLDCLGFLLEHHGDSEPTAVALAEARRDHEEPVQRFALRAGLARGQRLSHPEALVMLTSGQDADRLDGLAAMSRAEPLPEVQLLGCLRSGGDEVAWKAAQLLAARGDRLAMTELARAAKRPDLGAVARGRVEAAHALIFDRLGGGLNAGGLALAGSQPAALSLVEPAQEGQLAVLPTKEPQG